MNKNIVKLAAALSLSALLCGCADDAITEEIVTTAHSEKNDATVEVTEEETTTLSQEEIYAGIVIELMVNSDTDKTLETDQRCVYGGRRYMGLVTTQDRKNTFTEEYRDDEDFQKMLETGNISCEELGGKITEVKIPLKDCEATFAVGDEAYLYSYPDGSRIALEWMDENGQYCVYRAFVSNDEYPDDLGAAGVIAGFADCDAEFTGVTINRGELEKLYTEIPAENWVAFLCNYGCISQTEDATAHGDCAFRAENSDGDVLEIFEPESNDAKYGAIAEVTSGDNQKWYAIYGYCEWDTLVYVHGQGE